MEFWGVEVKSGETLKVNPGDSRVLHLSQACLGELKKDKVKDSVCLFVNIEGKKLVLGTLSPERLPQQLFDLVFDKDFELSHNWKSGSVYFYGYKADNPYNESEDDEEFDSEDDEDIPLQIANNGKPEIEAKENKPSVAEKAKVVKDSAAGKKKVKIVQSSKGVNPEEDEDESDESDADMAEAESDSEEDDEDSSNDDDDSEKDDDSNDEDEETPKKVESGKKKRPLESASKTPVSGKKAKLATPQKTDGKKGGVHVATPHPSKQAGKTPAKSNQKSPASEGSLACKPCNRTFKSDIALQSHNQAKHSSSK